MEDSPIASLSLGQKRDFVFKHAQVLCNNCCVEEEMYPFFSKMSLSKIDLAAVLLHLS